MNKLFIFLLVISILFPLYSFFTMLNDFAHNQYQGRQERLNETTEFTESSPHLGLTNATLARLDELVRDAYKDSVYDGYRLGRGYNSLWLKSMALDGLLFVSSLAGLSVCRKLARQTWN